MNFSKNSVDKIFLENLCELIYRQEFSQSEKIVVELVEETAKRIAKDKVLINNKNVIQTIYYYFNNVYNDWLRKKGINIKHERQKLNSDLHSNYFIAHAANAAEMDDLLYGILSYRDTTEERDELLYNLRCYKKQSKKSGILSSVVFNKISDKGGLRYASFPGNGI